MTSPPDAAYVAPIDDTRNVDVVLDELIARRAEKAHVHVPLPSAAKGTKTYEHEAKVTIWRIQITESQERIELAFDNLANTINNSWWKVMWTTLRALGVGALDLAKECMVGLTAIATATVSNENGQLKYITLIVLGLGIIAYGGAMTGWGMTLSTGTAETAPKH